MNSRLANYFSRFKSSFSWSNQEDNILNSIEKNKVIKKTRDSIAEKHLRKRIK